MGGGRKPNDPGSKNRRLAPNATIAAQAAGLPLPIHRQRDQLKDVAQDEASPVCASDGRKGQDEENDKDDHPTAAASAGATASEAEALLQPIEGRGQQKEFEKSF